MSPYEELELRVSQALWKDNRYQGVGAALREVFRTLETVTQEMVDAWRVANPDFPDEIWLAMLRASPLPPPKDKSND